MDRGSIYRKGRDITKFLLHSWLELLLLVLVIMLFAGGLSCAAGLRDTENLFSLKSEGEGWEAGLIKEQREKGAEGVLIPQYTVWGEKTEETIQNPDLGRSLPVAVLSVCGSTALLFPGETILAEGDEEGCLLDLKSAQKLYGSSNPVGKEITLLGKTYQIRGVLKSVQDTIVIQAESKTILDRVTAQITGTQSRQEVRQILSGSCGLSGTELEWRLLGEAAGAANLLLPLLCLLWFVKTVQKLGKSARGRNRWLLRMAGIICAAAWICLLFSNVSVPQDYLPGKWSDFDFWTQLWEKIKESWHTLIRVEKREPELPFVMNFIRLLSYQAGANILALLLYIRCKGNIVFTKNS